MEKNVIIDNFRFCNAQSCMYLDTDVPSIPGRNLIHAKNHTIVNYVPPKVVVSYHEGSESKEMDIYPILRKKVIPSIDFNLACILNKNFSGQQFGNIEEFTEELLKFLSE